MLFQILYQEIRVDFCIVKYEHRKPDSGFGNLRFLFFGREGIREGSPILILRCGDIWVSD